MMPHQLDVSETREHIQHYKDVNETSTTTTTKIKLTQTTQWHSRHPKRLHTRHTTSPKCCKLKGQECVSVSHCELNLSLTEMKLRSHAGMDPEDIAIVL